MRVKIIEDKNLGAVVSRKKPAPAAKPVEVISPEEIYDVLGRCAGAEDRIWYQIGEDEWIMAKGNVKELSNKDCVTPSMAKTLGEYKYVYKSADDMFYATKAEQPFKDTDDIDEYKMYAYDRLDIPKHRWYPVEKILND